MTRKGSPLWGRNRRKLRQSGSQIHGCSVWRLVRVILLLLLKNGRRQWLWYFDCWWRLMTTKGPVIRQHMDPFLECLPFESACRRSYDILLPFPWLRDWQGCPPFCFVFGFFPTLVDDLNIVVEYGSDYRHHVSFDDSRSNTF